MQWSDVIKPPPPKVLRQFAGLWLIFFLGLAGWRWFGGRPDTVAMVLAILAVVVGGAGLAMPAIMRPIFTGWMVVVFPIGWTVSRIVLGAVFFLLVTPIAVVFKLMGRDLLRRRRPTGHSYWIEKRQPAKTADYMRQF